MRGRRCEHTTVAARYLATHVVGSRQKRFAEMTNEPGFFFVHVRTVRQLSPNLVRIIFGGDDLAKYVSIGAPDESVAIYFPAQGQSRPEPMEYRNGSWGYFDPERTPVGRNYTVRGFDPESAELTIDFVVHDGGVAAQWAIHAAAGRQVLFSRPRAWYRPPADMKWQLLAADLAGLPALARIISELDGTIQTHVVLEVIDQADLVALPSGPNVTVDTVVGTGNGVTPSVLAARVRDFVVPAAAGYVWFAGEAAESRSVRKHLRQEHGFSADRYDTIGYWRTNAERWIKEYTQVQDKVLAVYRSALDEGRSEKEAAEVLDLELERVGL